jgi:LacI family transcriptional regulator
MAKSGQPMKKRPTVADVARAAGVSMMTVSRAINNKPGLSDELRQKILALVDEMGYRPSQIAQGLATRQTSTVGLVVPDITNPFYAPIARGAEDVAYEYGYSVFLINTAGELDREAVALDSLWRKEIDGAILCSLRMPNDALESHVSRFPAVVLFNRELKKPMPNVVTINVNDQRGAMVAVEHLVESGRRQIAYLSGPSNSYSSQRRLEGYRQALRNANLPFDPHLVEGVSLQENSLQASVQAAVLALLARRPDLDGIFAFNDLVAISAIQVCQEQGKTVPQDVSIIGADDIPLGTVIRPQLSTLHVSLTHIGRLAMRTLLEIFAGEASPGAYQIEPELILRESG